ncbi:MAG: ABC transporter permease subunit [Lachnospiraceae bacterium]|nr:ABC transporter permease subunit [Lachnospiraceae bacterium]
MKSAWFNIFKKELDRFFGDKRLVITAIIMPGVMIYLMYSFMGSAFSDMYSVDDDYKYSVAVVGMPEEMDKMFTSGGFETEKTEFDKLDEVKDKLSNEELDLCIVFPENIMEALASFDGKVEDVPNIEVYYNSTSTASSAAYSVAVNLLNSMEEQVSNVFDINKSDDASIYDVATNEDTTGMLLSTVLPFLLMTLMFSGCTALAPESIAGEKERGTMATLLVTPIPRNQIAIGKISALALIALLSGLSSFLGTFLSMPKLMGDVEALGVSTSFYKPADYFGLVLIMLSTVLFLITAISIISAFSKTIKEAQTYVAPLMLVNMALSLSTMFTQNGMTEVYWYIIPCFNSAMSISSIFSFSVQPVNIAVTVVSNFVYSVVGIFVLTKMFSSEKIIFDK